MERFSKVFLDLIINLHLALTFPLFASSPGNFNPADNGNGSPDPKHYIWVARHESARRRGCDA
jgi:hypothetical protein